VKLGYFANQNDLGLKKPFHQVVAETREIARTCDAAGSPSIISASRATRSVPIPS
jgi:pyruvate kinase